MRWRSRGATPTDTRGREPSPSIPTSPTTSCSSECSSVALSWNRLGAGQEMYRSYLKPSGGRFSRSIARKYSRGDVQNLFSTSENTSSILSFTFSILSCVTSSTS